MSQVSGNFLSPEFLSNYEGKRPKNAGVLFEVTHLNKYSWWLEGLKRRETWTETCKRVVEYSASLYDGPYHDRLVVEAELMFKKMWELEAMPAGRTMRIGGTPACYKFPEMCYNCSFTTIKDIQALVDSFHLSLCSVGLGFRVLIEDVAKLEDFCQEVVVDHLPYKYENSGREYTSNDFKGYQGKYPCYELTVGDSKEGWVQALETFLVLSHAHNHDYSAIKWIVNYNHIRPKGQRIKTAGGFAAGHEGMQEMFTRLADTLTNKGGRLNPVAAMDSQNIVGKNVVTGGNRRSAQIALGSPEDEEFIKAKLNLYTRIDGKWSVPPELEHRKMSNNSIVFTSKPSRDILKGLFESIKNNGEPGFFNLEAARKRRPNCEGLNPCLTSDMWISTSEGPRKVKELIDSPYKALINGIYKNASPFWSTGVKPVYEISTVEGYKVKTTKDHKILTDRGWIEAQDLIPDDLIILNNLNGFKHEWQGKGSFQEGWLIGSLIGDGTFTAGKNGNHSEADLRFWGQDKELVSAQALSFMKNSVESRSDCRVVKGGNGYLQVGSVGLSKLAESFGITHHNKHQITPEIEKASSDFYSGFLQGLFDADGSPQGSTEKGRSVRLAQSNVVFLQGVQRMLLRLGIKSTLYPTRMPEGFRLLPDGKGGNKDYFCKTGSELVVSKDNILRFKERIGFSEPLKQKRLEQFTGPNKRAQYRDKFTARFKNFSYINEEEVFDCTVEDLHRFDANGIIVHNCAEILLDDKGVCNLSTVIMPSHLVKRGEHWYVDEVKLEESIRLATRIGMRQTNVTLSLPEWDKVQKRDRLTGVSFTGWEDFLDVLIRYTEIQTTRLLGLMNKWANDEADKYAYEMRIPRPLLVTAIKPEGTISLLPTVSWGLHRAFAPYYIRRVSVTITDPLNGALKEIGVPWEKDEREAESTRDIFLFPVETPAKTAAYDEPARDQLARYFLMQRNYTDHNSSCTIYVGSGYDGYEDEWKEVLDIIDENWDDVIAVSFLSKHSLDNPPYPQMPNTACSKETYNNIKKLGFMERLPELYDRVAKHEQAKTEYYETEMDACTGGVCPVA